MSNPARSRKRAPIGGRLAALAWLSGGGSYGIAEGMAPPDGPKSGWRRVVAADMFPSHAWLRAWTGRSDTSACHTLFGGRIGQFGAPGVVLAAAGQARIARATAASVARRSTYDLSAGRR